MSTTSWRKTGLPLKKIKIKEDIHKLMCINPKLKVCTTVILLLKSLDVIINLAQYVDFRPSVGFG